MTLVVQTGIPQNAEQYIHRLGRTARAGQGGRGILVLTTDEMTFIRGKEIKDLPITAASVGEASLSAAREATATALAAISPETKSSAYAAWLGYYKMYAKTFTWSIPQLIEQAKVFALETCGYIGDREGQTPPLLAKTVGLMGLREYRSSFNIVAELPGKPKQAPRQNQGGGRDKKQRLA